MASVQTKKTLPRHIGFIVDGNRRWAKERGLRTYEGHFVGYDRLKDVLIETLNRGVQYASCYIFSTENWSRPQVEIDKIMELLLKGLIEDLHIFTEENVKLRIIGSRHRLKPAVLVAIQEAEQTTASNTGGELLLCINYGGHQEIVEAVRAIVAEGVDKQDINPELLSRYMYAPDIPPCDLIVRTGGEQRLSGFMLWRAAYSEFIFIKKYWPDMTRQDVSDILDEYAKRNRRFGG